MKKALIRRILCLALSASVISPYAAVKAETAYETVQLVSNGGFEYSDSYGFPDSWSSNGENLFLGGDFETGNAAITNVGQSPTGKTLRWASPNTSSATISVTESDTAEKEDHGNYYAKLNFISSAWGGLGYPNVSKPDYLINAAYGGSYIFRADYKVSSTAAFSAAKMSAYYLLTASETEVNNETKFEKKFADTSSTPSTAWQTATATMTIVDKPTAEGYTYYDIPNIQRLQFRYDATPTIANGSSADLYVDNLRLEKLGRTSDESRASGTNSLKIVGYADTEDEIWESDAANVTAGEEISVSAKVLAESLSAYTVNSMQYTGQIDVIAVFDDGSEINIGSITQAGSEYVTVSKSVTAPAGASQMQIRLVFSGTGVAYIDDVSATVQREAEDIVVPDDYKNILANGGFESYDKYGFPSGWDSDGKNLIVNGNFETNSLESGLDITGNKTLSYGYYGGVPKGNVTVAANDAADAAEYGSYSMRMQWDGKVTWGGAGINNTAGIFRMSYGNDYIFRASAKAGGAEDFTTSSHKFQFNIITNYAKDTLMSQNTWIPTTNWQEFAYTYSAPEQDSSYPAEAFATRVQWRANGTNSETAVMYVDNISVEKTSRTDSTSCKTGSRSLMIDGYADSDGADEVWTSEEVAITGGEDVYFGLSYKQDSITSGAGARFVFTDASGNAVSTKLIDLGTGSRAWSSRTLKETVPENVAGAYVELFVKEGTGTLWADDVFVSVLPEEEHINVTIPDGIRNAIANNGFETVDDKAFPDGWSSDGKNLIVNGDFEKEEYWYVAGASAGGTREFSYSDDSMDGSVSGNLKWTTDPVTGLEEWGCIAQREGYGTPPMTPIAVALDSDYIVRMDTKAEGSIKNNNVNIMAELKNGANAWNLQTMLNVTAGTEWDSYTATYHTPSASEEKNGNNPSVSMGYIFYIYAGRAIGIAIEDGQTQLWIDNLSLEKLGRADTAEYTSGEKSLKVVGYNDGVSEVWESDDVLEVTAGEEIYYGGKAKLQGLKSYARFAVNFYDENGVFVSSDAFGAGRGTKDWADYSDSATAPANAAYAKLALIVENGNGTAWFDDVILGKMVSGIYSTKPVFNFDEIATNAGKVLTASTNVYNYGEAENLTFVLALYNGDTLVNVDMQSADAAAEGIQLTASVAIPDGEYSELSGYLAKTFVWKTATKAPVRACDILPGSKTEGDIVMSSMYGDNMVLQQGEAIMVSGTAADGAAVSVTLGENTESTTAGDDGEWTVSLPQMTAGGPYTMVVADNRGHKKVFSNIMIGEVWLVSGQSNVQYITSYFDGLEQYTQDNEMIRLFSVPRIQADEKVDTLSGGEWKQCTASVASGFSAVGYLLAKELSEAMPGVPVGIVESSVAGSDIGEWMDDEISVLANVTTAAEKRSKRYNGMIYPLRGFNYAGVAWYQGESSRNWLYQTWLEAMVSNWRNTFGNTNLDFAIVQLPGYMQDGFAIVREGQRLAALADDNMHMSVNIDLGEKEDVHPSDKAELVERLANVILKEVYGEDIDCYGPTFSGVELEGNKAIVTFDNAEGLKTTDGNAPTEFIIAGADGEFFVADAVINGGKVELTSDSVAAPVYVRYAFEGYPEPNLVNGNNLPAEPFRTDSINTVYPFEG